MNQESASVVVACHFVKPNEYYTPTLLCNYGDLYQLYTGDASSVQDGDCSPNFAAPNKYALVELWLNRADGDTIDAGDIANVRWFVGETEILFNDSNGESIGTDFKGVFQRINASATAKPGLKIVKNLVGPLRGISSQLKAVATVTDSAGKPFEQSQVMPITLSQVTNDSYSISIKGGDLDGKLAITTNGQKLNVTAIAYEGINKITLGTDWQLVWDCFADDGNGNKAWIRRTEKSTGVIEVLETEVQSNMFIRCALCKKTDVGANYATAVIDNPDAAGYVRPYAIDTACVYDTSDPYVINPNPTPEDCIMKKGISKIEFDPVMSRRDGSGALTNAVFTFNVLSLAGTKMRGPVTPAKPTLFSLSQSDFNQASDINVHIDGVATISS